MSPTLIPGRDLLFLFQTVHENPSWAAFITTNTMEAEGEDWDPVKLL